MIQVHNFYKDLLLYMRHLFDDVIFGQGIIKGYEFNLGNRTFQLDYKSQYELPRVMFNFQESHAVTHHPWLIHRVPYDNPSKFPVLFDKTKNLTLEMQEEEYEISITATINCESQYSAIQFHHRLITNSPLEKPLDLSHFYSFLEIPDEFLNRDMFDVNNDDIVNLYLKYNPLTSKPSYCCSVRYEPMVRLDSCTVEVSTSEPRSFPVQCQFTLLMGLPIYMQIPLDEHPSSRPTEFFMEPNVTLPIQSTQPILQILGIEDDNHYHFSVPLFYDTTSGDFSQTVEYEDLCVKLEGNINSIQSIGHLKTVIHDQEHICNFVMITSLSGNSSISVSGPLSGSITSAIVSDHSFSGVFYGEYHGNRYNLPIRCDYQIDQESFILNGPIKFIQSNKPLSFTSQILPSGYNMNLMLEANARLLKYIPEKTQLVSVQLYETDTKKVHEIDIKGTLLDSFGNFLVALDHKHSETNKSVFVQFQGKLHPKTLQLTTDIIEEQIDYAFQIVSVTFNIGFESAPKYGARIIERVQFDLVTDDNVPIATANSLRFFKDEFERLRGDFNRKILLSLVITPSKEDPFFICSGFLVSCRIILDDSFDYDKLIQKKNLQFRIIFEDQFYLSNSSLFYLKPRDENSMPNVLEFECDFSLYEEKFKHYSNINPIFFQIFEIL